MTPPEAAAAATLHPDTEDLHSVRWAGWALAAAVVLPWAGWISLTVIDNQSTLERLLERQSLQYQQLHDAVVDLKETVSR